MTSRNGKVLVLICTALVIVSFQFTRYADYDLWWHLKLGDGILQAGRIYGPDTFSYTFAGAHQTSSEWLSDLLIALIFKADGFLGLNALKAFLVLLTLLFVYLTLTLRRPETEASDRNRTFAAAVLTVLAVLFAIRFRLFVRPYLFHYLWTAVYLYVLERFRTERNLRVLFVLPVVQVVWANMYSASLFGPLLFGLFLFGTFFERERRKELPRLGLVLTAILAATLVSPEGYHAYAILYRVSTDPTIAKFGEFQPLSLGMLWGPAWTYTAAYQVIVAGCLVFFLFLRGWKDVYYLLIFGVFFAESILHVRMIDIFSLAAAPFLCRAIEAALRVMPRFRVPEALAVPAACLAILSVIPVSVIGNKTYPFGSGVKEGAFPEKAVAFLEREGITGRMFNSYAYGGYLIWRSPDRKVFIDGRYSRPYTAEFYNSYREALEKPEVWEQLDKKWGFDYAVLEYDLKSRQFPMHLNMNPDWALVYWDSSSAVYLKRKAENQKTIARHEYHTVKPAFYDFSMLEHQFRSKGVGYPLVQQIDRDIALNPENQEPRLAKVFVLFYLGPSHYHEALDELTVTLAMKPDLAMKHSAAASLLLSFGRNDEARAEVRKALALDPSDLQARELKRTLLPD